MITSERTSKLNLVLFKLGGCVNRLYFTETDKEKNQVFSLRGKMIGKIIIIAVLITSLPLSSIFNSGQQGTKWNGTIEYEDEVKVIKNPAKPLYGEIELELEEDLIIGNEKDENYLFNFIFNINVDMNGNIYVVDFKEKHIQVYDKFGTHTRTIGRRGQGPGEFQNPSYLHIGPEGNIYVQEMYKFHQFGPKGVFKRSMPIGNPVGYQLTQLAILEGEKILARLHKTTEKGTVSKIALLDNSGKEIKTIVEYPPYELDPIVNGRMISLWNPYHYMPLLSPYTNGLGLYAFSKEYELVIINSSGERVFIIRKAEPPSSVTKKEKDLLVNRNFKVFKERPSRKNRYNLSKNEIKKMMKFPNHKPYFINILTDGDGNIYVMKLKDPSEVKYGVIIDYFDFEGKYLYRFILKDKVPQVFRNGYIYTVEQEFETSYQRVKRYKISNWNRIKEDIE